MAGCRRPWRQGTQTPSAFCKDPPSTVGKDLAESGPLQGPGSAAGRRTACDDDRLGRLYDGRKRERGDERPLGSVGRYPAGLGPEMDGSLRGDDDEPVDERDPAAEVRRAGGGCVERRL